MGPVPKIVSLSPPVEAAAGLVPNRATIEDIEAALLRAPNLLARLGLYSEDGRTLDLHQLGLGHYAHAFLLPSGLVLKVTDDEDDARVCKMVMDLANGKPGLPFIEAVYRLPGDVYENETDAAFERPLFAIVMEPVTPASKAGLSRTRNGEVRNRLLGEAILYPSMEAELATDEARAFVKTIRRGVHWLAQHGVSVVDLHHGNFGYASGKRPVLIDFGHGSLQDEFIMKPIEMASNPQKPTDRDVRDVWRALGSPEVDLDELRMGIEVEQEHGVDMREAGQIAMDHLREFPDYYTRLTKMEARAKAGLAPNAKKLPTFLSSGSSAVRWAKRHVADLDWDNDGEVLEEWAFEYADFARQAWRDGRIEVYRAVAVPSHEKIRFDKLGKSWSYDRRGVGVYNKIVGEGEREVVLTAVVRPEDVDWEFGFTSFMYYGPDQSEVSMNRHAPVEVIAVDGKALAEPVRGSTGDSHESWTPNGRAMPVTPNGRKLSRAQRAFDECFDVIEERFPDFGDIELHEDELAGSDNGAGSERQFGYCMDGKPIRIAFAAKIEKLPVENIRGLMAHEFGHALDYRYGKKLGSMLGVRLPEGVERRADAIAKAVFGRTIKYDERLIQCVDCDGTSPRPRRLGP